MTILGIIANVKLSMSHDIQKKGEIAVKQNQFFFIKLLGVEKQYSDQFHPPA